MLWREKNRWDLATIFNTLNSYVLNQIAKFGRLICPKPYSSDMTSVDVL